MQLITFCSALRQLVGKVASLGAVVASLLCAPAWAQTKAYSGYHQQTRETSFTYDPASGLLTSETLEPNDPQSCVTTSYELDEYGNRKKATTKPCAGAPAQVAFAERSTQSAFTAAGAAFPAAFAARPGVPDGAFALASTNALGHKEYRRIDPATGLVEQAMGPNGLVTTLRYDQFGRKVYEQRPDQSHTRTWYCFVPGDMAQLATHAGNTNGRPANLEHPNLGNCATVAADEAQLAATLTVPHAGAVAYFVHVQAYLSDGSLAGPFGRTYYDQRGREVRMVTQAFDGGPLNQEATKGQLVVKDTYYHPSGVQAAVTQPYFLGTKRSVVATTAANPAYGYSYTEYDVLGRPTMVYTADTTASDAMDLVDMPATRPAGLPVVKASKVEFAYQGMKTLATRKITREGQLRTLVDQQERNPEGKVVRTTDALGAQQVFEYDALGNMVRSFDAMGSGNGASLQDANVVAVAYDKRGRKVAMSDPNKGNWSYKYNALGELVEQSNANSNGQPTKLKYDLLGRLIERDGPGDYARYQFDTRLEGGACSDRGSSIGLLCATTTQRPGQATPNALVRRTHYDDKLRPLRQDAQLYAGNGALERRFVSSTTYQANGRVQKQAYPTGLEVGFAYTRLGFVNQVGDWAGSAIGTQRWLAGTVNAWGRAESYTLGPAAVQRHEYDPQAGRMLKAGAGISGTGNNVFDHNYEWDTLGNLTRRADVFGAYGAKADDWFYYDNLNRLVRYKVEQQSAPLREVALRYNAAGSILYRSDVGDYSYAPSGSALPHAVYAVRGTVNADYAYDALGNMRSASTGPYREVNYNGFNQPNGELGILGRNGNRYTFVYDEAQQRVVERHSLPAGATRTTYKLHPDNAGGMGFEQEREGAAVTNRHYLSAGGGVVAMVLTEGDIYAAGQEATGTPLAGAKSVKRAEYWHKDHLGSIVAVTEFNAQGVASVRARYAYDPWGKRRNPDGSFNGLAPGDYPNGVDRGYTGHEHLDDVGIIHMNGRLYDPVLARFMQADPVVGDPFDMQTLNGYSYVYNRPLVLTDATGQCPVCWFVGATLFARAVGIIDQKTFRGLMAIGIGWALGPAALNIGGGPLASTAIAGFASGAIASGDLKGGFRGMFSSMLFFGMGSLADGLRPDLMDGMNNAELAGGAVKADIGIWGSAGAGRAGLHAIAGCIQSSISGGSCKSGALGSAGGVLLGPLTHTGHSLTNTFMHAAVGGTVSVLGGGKFASGAMSSAYGYLFNELSHYSGSSEDRLRLAGYGATTYDDGTICNPHCWSDPPLEGVYPEAALIPATRGAGVLRTIANWFKRDELTINWGTNRQDADHAIRHVRDAGLSVDKVKDAIRQDLIRRDVGNAPTGGLGGHNPVTVQGVTVRYSGYKLPDGSINVSSIRPPR